MLPRKHRLTRKEIVGLKGGKLRVIQGQFFGLIFQPQANERKFGLIISNKISPKAVERNRVKRMLFIAIEEKLLDKEGKFLFLAKKKSLTGTREDFLREVEGFKKRLT
jgi:ribonuclease P protein component